jgi:hypothetical protein
LTFFLRKSCSVIKWFNVVLTFPIDTPLTVCKEFPEYKGVLLPSLKMDQKIFLPPLAVILKLKNKLCVLPEYLLRVNKFTTGGILTTLALSGP